MKRQQKGKVVVIRKSMLMLAGILFSFSAVGATYYDQPVVGEVYRLEVNSLFTSGRNLIVELKNSAGRVKLCNESSESGYINKSDNPDTFSAFLSLLLSAKATKDTVMVLTADGSEGCRIDRVQLQ